MPEGRLQRTREAYEEAPVTPHAASCACSADWPAKPCPADCEHCTCRTFVLFEDERRG